MQKKISLWIFSIITLVAFSYGLALSLSAADKKRTALANYYSQQANLTTDPAAQNLWLIKSDSLSPNKDTKVRIALNYFQLNEPQKAKDVLIFAGSEQANYLLAQYYILNSPLDAERFIEKISDSKIKQELLASLAIAHGGPVPPNSFVNPKSDLANILTSGATERTIDSTNRPFLEGWLKNLPLSERANTQTLNIANYFIKSNQPNFTLFVLSNLTTRVGTVPAASKLKARAYAELKNYQLALQYQNEVINMTPEDVEAYKLAASYAKLAGDKSRTDFLNARIQELEKLQK